MLPNFIIIGAAKAASTWLSDCMGEHPDVFMAEIKEVRYFSVAYDRGLDWYKTHFADWNGEKAVGEANPGYLGDDHAPARIKETLGDVPLILSMRHPVDRAYSAYWKRNQLGTSLWGSSGAQSKLRPWQRAVIGI